MPQMTINIKIEEIAKAIACMEKKDLETLSIILSDEGAELLERKQDIESKQVSTLSKEEVFDAWLFRWISSQCQKRPKEDR